LVYGLLAAYEDTITKAQFEALDSPRRL